MSFRILVVEDHNLLREGLRALLASVDTFEVVAQANGGKQALLEILSSSPDLILMDISMPSMDGIEAIIQIKRRKPETKIIALSAYRTEEYVREALKAGVDGYVLKDISFDELLVAIRTVASGKKYLSSDISQQMVDRYLNGGSASEPGSSWEKLTSRERSIVKLVVEGKTNRSSAEFLNVSQKTVEKHRASLMIKLGLKNATELVLLALENGWVDRKHINTRVRL
jgi:DNA-binding NarL/FixJ family response regulator